LKLRTERRAKARLFCRGADAAVAFGGAQQLPQITAGARCRFWRISKEKTSGQDSPGRWDMLDAIQISVALWAMIVCGGIKLAQVVHYLF
jgi:hypothetical protein